MARPSRVTRVVWLLTALLQLALPGATAWADARLEREAMSPRGASHVESQGSPQCPRVHPPDCALCQHLSSPLARTAPVGVIVTASDPCVPSAEPGSDAHAPPIAFPQPRAPPLS